jgi:glycosyltransferase involved in cell wall biosynthesis
MPDDARLDVSVVVPVYDNARTLEELCRRTCLVLEGEGLSFEILCVDDGSRDDSWAMLEKLAAGDPRVVPVRLARNFGQAAALCAGFDRIRGAIAVTIDADLQNHPEDIPLLLAEMANGHDLVSGIRQGRSDPRFGRLVPSHLANRLVRSLVGVPLHDVGCGLNAVTRRLAMEFRHHGEMRRFLKPLAAMLAETVAEVPVRHSPDPSGRSRYSFMSLVGVQLDFFTSFSRKPFQLIGIAGFALSAIGLLAGLAVLGLWLFDVSAGPRVHTLVILSTMFGLQFAVLGLLGEFIVRIFHAQNQPFYVVRDERRAPGGDGDA